MTKGAAHTDQDSSEEAAAGLGGCWWRSAALRAALIALVLSRGWYVLARADVFFYGEELEKGACAKALIDRIELPYHELAYHYYELGGFFVSHLKALSFLLVGESILAHKLLAIAWCALMLVAGWVLVARHFGERAAGLFAWLFVLAPAAMQKLSLLSLGIHFEACLFLLIVLDRGLRLLFEPARARDMLWLGLASGLGISFSYQLVPAVGFVGLLLLARRPRLVLSRLGALGLGSFLLGLAPFLWMYALVGRALFDIHGASLGAGEGGVGAQAAARLVPFLRSVFVEAAPWSRVGALLLTALVLTAMGQLAWRGAGAQRRRGPAVVLIGFALFWCLVYVASGFVVGPVYHDFLWMRLAPLWVVATLLLAAWAQNGRARLAAGALLVMGLVAAGQILSQGTPSRLGEGWRLTSRLKGYDYAGYFSKLSEHIAGDSLARLAPLLGFREQPVALLRAELATNALRDARLHGRLETLPEELRELAPDALEDFALGLGSWAVARGGGSVAGVLEFSSRYPAGVARALQEGAGRSGIGDGYLLESLEQELDSLPPQAPLAAYLEGVGYRAFRRLVVGPYGGAFYVMKPERVRARLAARPAEQASALLLGFEHALALHSLARD